MHAKLCMTKNSISPYFCKRVRVLLEPVVMETLSKENENSKFRILALGSVAKKPISTMQDDADQTMATTKLIKPIRYRGFIRV